MESNLFNSDGSCYKHDNYDCKECMSKASKAITLVPLTGSEGKSDDCRKAKAVENFERQVDFVQTVLGVDDQKLDKVKIADMPKMMQQAQKKVTIGHMKKLLGKQKLGFVGGFVQGVYCAIRGNR